MTSIAAAAAFEKFVVEVHKNRPAIVNDPDVCYVLDQVKSLLQDNSSSLIYDYQQFPQNLVSFYDQAFLRWCAKNLYEENQSIKRLITESRLREMLELRIITPRSHPNVVLDKIQNMQIQHFLSTLSNKDENVELMEQLKQEEPEVIAWLVTQMTQTSAVCCPPADMSGSVYVAKQLRDAHIAVAADYLSEQLMDNEPIFTKHLVTLWTADKSIQHPLLNQPVSSKLVAHIYKAFDLFVATIADVFAHVFPLDEIKTLFEQTVTLAVRMTAKELTSLKTQIGVAVELEMPPVLLSKENLCKVLFDYTVMLGGEKVLIDHKTALASKVDELLQRRVIETLVKMQLSQKPFTIAQTKPLDRKTLEESLQQIYSLSGVGMKLKSTQICQIIVKHREKLTNDLNERVLRHEREKKLDNIRQTRVDRRSDDKKQVGILMQSLASLGDALTGLDFLVLLTKALAHLTAMHALEYKPSRPLQQLMTFCNIHTTKRVITAKYPKKNKISSHRACNQLLSAVETFILMSCLIPPDVIYPPIEKMYEETRKAYYHHFRTYNNKCSSDAWDACDEMAWSSHYQCGRCLKLLLSRARTEIASDAAQYALLRLGYPRSLFTILVHLSFALAEAHDDWQDAYRPVLEKQLYYYMTNRAISALFGDKIMELECALSQDDFFVEWLFKCNTVFGDDVAGLADNEQLSMEGFDEDLSLTDNAQAKHLSVGS